MLGESTGARIVSPWIIISLVWSNQKATISEYKLGCYCVQNKKWYTELNTVRDPEMIKLKLPGINGMDVPRWRVYQSEIGYLNLFWIQDLDQVGPGVFQLIGAKFDPPGWALSVDRAIPTWSSSNPKIVLKFYNLFIKSFQSLCARKASSNVEAFWYTLSYNNHFLALIRSFKSLMYVYVLNL